MTQAFKDTPLDVEWIDGIHWRLLHDLEWTSAATGHSVRVEAGYVTDFASIPRIFWSRLPPTGPYGKAAVLHDWLYSRGKWADGTPLSRGEADAVLNEAMGDLGVRADTRRLVYWGVRVGGWYAWRKYR